MVGVRNTGGTHEGEKKTKEKKTNGQADLKFKWKCATLRTVKTIMKKKANAGGLTLPDFKTYCILRCIKID